jgi:Mlc titration factor MtfA (ptsG expression regulator)
MQQEFDAFRERVVIAQRFGGEPTWLDPYGAESIDEFFAVACEGYFVNRPRFQAEFPGLVPLLDGFFQASAATGS